MADGEPVFHDVLPLGDGAQGQLVALRDVFRGGDAHAAELDLLALCDGVQRDGHVVIRMDLNALGHVDALTSFP